MESFIKKFTGAAKALPKQVAKTTTAVAKTVAKAPAAAHHAIRDTVSLGQTHTGEVNRAQVSRATKAPAPQAKRPAPKASKPSPQAKKPAVAPQSKPTVKSVAMNTEMIKEMTPAQQRAYFQRASERSGNSIANLKSDFDKPLNRARYSDEILTDVVKTSGSWVKDKAVGAYDYVTGSEGQRKADATARELEKNNQDRFEARLKAQNPERYEQYKKSQAASNAQIQAEHTKEHWQKRDARLYEEARSSYLLAQDPSKLEQKLSPERLARYKNANAASMENIVEGTRPEHWAKNDAEAAQAQREKALVPGKEAWLKSLSPEQREAYLARQSKDDKSIMASAMKRHENLETIKDVASLGSHSVSKEDGLLAGTADLLTMGAYAASKGAGEELGKGLTYLDQAESLKNAGCLNDAQDFSEQGTQKTAMGVVNLAMAGASGYGAIKSLHGQLIKRLKPPTTVTAKVSCRMGEGSVVTGNRVASETAQTFDEMVQASKNAGFKERIDVNMVKYERVHKIGFKPEFREVPTQHHINVHGGDNNFAQGIADSLDNLPEASYQAVNKIDDIHVADTKYFKNADGTISDDMMGAVDLSGDRARMVLNRESINRPLNNLPVGANHEAVSSATNSASRNLNKTVWHEVGHVHDKLLKNLSSKGRFALAEGKSYSKYAAESGSLSEEFAEGYAHLMEQRRDMLSKGFSEDDFIAMAEVDEAFAGRNTVILEDALYGDINEELMLFNPVREARMQSLPEAPADELARIRESLAGVY